MRLERLLALIRLANNNPDENEANLAARKVCQILADKKDAPSEFTIAPKQIRTAAGKMNETLTWNDVKRSTEPAWKSQSYDPAYNPFEEFFRKYAKADRHPFDKETSWTGFDWSKAPKKDAPEPDYEPPRYKEASWINWDTRKERPQEERTCSKCGLKIKTFRIKENPWVCNFCHWKDFK